MYTPSVHHLTRSELERQYLGVLTENQRLKKKVRVYKPTISHLNTVLHLRKVETELLRHQLESQVRVAP
jgi:hypothetical protein